LIVRGLNFHLQIFGCVQSGHSAANDGPTKCEDYVESVYDRGVVEARA
jgi:hypothetical protein